MKYRKLRKYKYQLMGEYKRLTGITENPVQTSDLFVTLKDSGCIAIAKGYAWDGSSCSLDHYSIRASLVHDALYQLIREGLLDKKYRKQADQLYRDMLIEDGLLKANAWLRYWALRGFAGYAVKPKKEAEILEV